MKAYTEAARETLRTRDLLKDWAGEGLLTEAQYQRMEQETPSDLRRTNIFLRAVLFLFTLIIAGAAAGLFFTVFLLHPSEQTTGIFLLFFAALSYAAAELAVSQARLYRHGIEEALAAAAVAFLCIGLSALKPSTTETVVLTAGAIASLWIWHRFSLPCAFPAAMIFVIWLPEHWTSSHAAQHLILAALYASGLIAIAVYRDSIAEALLWSGIYLSLNLRLFSLKPFEQSLWGVPNNPTEFSRFFYWATYVIIWCLPPVILARGLRNKDRLVTGAGIIAALLTLITNKPYLNWPRHTWDPMLLGAFLIAIALYIRRWLAAGPAGIRHGFTAQRLSGKDKALMTVGTTALGLISPQSVTPAPQTNPPGVEFKGGDSGGGGATSDF